jgi:hypothetical protein
MATCHAPALCRDKEIKMSAVHDAWKEKEAKQAAAVYEAPEIWLARMRRYLNLAVKAHIAGNDKLANYLVLGAAINLEQAIE